MKEVKSFLQLLRKLPDKKSCREFLEKHRWNGEPICPHCRTESADHYRLKTKGEFNGLYKCNHCRNRFTVTIGTMFEGSNVSLDKWFYAIYIFLSHKKGISSVQLSKDIDVTQKTAWFMLSRIRYNFEDKIHVQFDDMTQIDETYVGGKNKGRFKKTQGRSLKTKTPVVGLLSGGQAYTIVVPNTSGRVLKPIVETLVRKGSTIITDGWKGYSGLSKDYTHKVIEHSNGVYVKDGFHTNSIEGFWSHLKLRLIYVLYTVKRPYAEYFAQDLFIGALRYIGVKNNSKSRPTRPYFNSFI